MRLDTLRRGLLTALLATSALSLPAIAQTPPAVSAQPSTDTTVVTIFGHRKGLISEQGLFALDTSSASSCGFGVGTGGRIVIYERWHEFAPFGDASQEGPPIEHEGTGLRGPQVARGALGLDPYQAGTLVGPGCGTADYAFAAGRVDIARRDTSLKDAMAAYKAKDYATALPLFKTAYNKLGVIDAADLIGQMYLLGQGTPRDTAQAIVWLKKAAEAPFTPGVDEEDFHPEDPGIMDGRTESAVTLAKIYALGWDVPASPKEARHWFGKAEEFGYIPASHMLGVLDESGYGGEGTLQSAVRHFLKAAKVGFPMSEYELGVIYYDGGDGVPQDKVRAGKWILAAAAGGNADALYACGRMYDLGEAGVKPDPQKALTCYKEGATRGQPDAQDAVGLSYYQGQGLPKDDKSARTWFERGAEGGSPDAMFNLAVMEANGEGGKADPTAAYAWLRIAQKGGLAKAGPAADELAGKLTPEERAKADAALKGS